MADTTNEKDVSEEIGIGSMCLSVDSSRRSPSVIVNDSSVTMVANDPAIGVSVDDSGVTIQGKVAFSSSGKNISKGIYTENDNSAKPFTYTETVDWEGTVKETVYDMLGKQGLDVSMFINQGFFPLMTNMAPGPLPHFHTMLFKHVHKVEPAYKYKISPVLTSLKTTLSNFTSFLHA